MPRRSCNRLDWFPVPRVMASRQFGLVVFRALAVYLLVMAINQLHQIINLYFLTADDYANRVLGPQKWITLGIWSLLVLMSAFLWTNGDKLVSSSPDSQPTLRGGNWVVRLVFTAIGVLICVYSFDNLVSLAVAKLRPPFWPEGSTPSMVLGAILDGVRLLIGITLICAYRFDKAAVVQAAEAIEPDESLPS